MRIRAVILATALATVPLRAQAADLVVWWEKGFYTQADEAVAEIVAAFEQRTGKQVEVVQPSQEQVFEKAQAALAAAQPPIFCSAPPVRSGRRGGHTRTSSPISRRL